jgi:hypothetical protein
MFPPGGAGSPRESGRGACPAVAGRISLPEAVVGAPSPLFGRSGVRPAGLALRLAPGCDADGFEIAVVDRAGGTLMRLGQFGEHEVVAMWRRLASVSGLPLLTQDEDGAVQQPYPQVGRLRLGRVRIRRGYGLGRRRPRFLTRRKTARLPRRPVIHRGREMFGEGRV